MGKRRLLYPSADTDSFGSTGAIGRSGLWKQIKMYISRQSFEMSASRKVDYTSANEVLSQPSDRWTSFYQYDNQTFP